MSNIGMHTMGIFEDDLLTVKECLKIALYTIFYHRWLNNNNYTDEESNITNISYKKINNDLLEKEINDLFQKIDNYSKSNQKLQITLSFYTTNRSFFFYSKNEGLWEKWNFLIIISNKEPSDRESKVRDYLFKIIKELNTEKDFMPDLELDNFENINDNNINNNNDFNFPFEIIVNPEFDQESILSILKNLNVKESFDNLL